MSVLELKKLDVLYLDEDDTDMVLGITDHLDWEDEAWHWDVLMDKINVYLAYIEVGEWKKRVPENVKSATIHIMFKYDIPDSIIERLKMVSEYTGKHGVGIRAEIMDDDDDESFDEESEEELDEESKTEEERCITEDTECRVELIELAEDLRPTAEQIFILCTFGVDENGNERLGHGMFFREGDVLIPALAEHLNVDEMTLAKTHEKALEQVARLRDVYAKNNKKIPAYIKFVFNLKNDQMQTEDSHFEKDRTTSAEALCREWEEFALKRYHLVRHETDAEKAAYKKELEQCHRTLSSLAEDLCSAADYIFILYTCKVDERGKKCVAHDMFFLENRVLMKPFAELLGEEESKIVAYKYQSLKTVEKVLDICEKYGLVMPACTKLFYDKRKNVLQVVDLSYKEEDKTKRMTELSGAWQRKVVKDYNAEWYEIPEKKGFWARLFGR